ncbi:PREDICTED: LOW QUALITY PROTEIN: F-box protein At1g10110 [Camelina sativa]|uniref:LOW QUALITY PROTEIN: F-box protein At1g10110 n=1 Tax=Camelina sativa TaxID=90675 RepID=A0ABM0YII4_CAMSA|nr:PREDICTED: LOW QUALITY PROTEIN: F-box protein At1g10110 [Camelina sativa]
MATDDDGTPNWSELVPDILSLVFKHLSVTDFARAKTVCSSWYSASKSSSPRQNHTPWLLLYEDTHWLLFNTEEAKFYRTGYFGRFAKCRGVVLVFDRKSIFTSLILFTPKLIRLPPLDSNRIAKFVQQDEIVDTAVLWVDEKTKDYLVAWTYFWGSYICYCRKRDQEWFEIPQSSRCLDMAYKDKKLYIHSHDGSIRILDFSLGDLPREIYNHPYAHRPFNPEIAAGFNRMKLTMSGDVLMVQTYHVWRGIADQRILFQVYKMGSTREYWDKVCSGKKNDALWIAGPGNAAYWERVHSLENEEALLWDLSVTLPTKGVSGIKKDSIYFCHTPSSSSIRDVAAYEIATHKISAYEIPPKQTIEPFQHRGTLIGEGRWFVPCFGAGE